jgi:hypothetical protein
MQPYVMNKKPRAVIGERFNRSLCVSSLLDTHLTTLGMQPYVMNKKPRAVIGENINKEHKVSFKFMRELLFLSYLLAPLLTPWRLNTVCSCIGDQLS